MVSLSSIMDCSGIPVGPAFGRMSEEVHSGHKNGGFLFKTRMNLEEIKFAIDGNEEAFKTKLMGYVPGLGTYVAKERVNRVKDNALLSTKQKMAHYLRAFFEAIPLLGLLVLCPTDFAVDKYREWKAKKVNILSRND